MRAAFDASGNVWERWNTRKAPWRPRGTFAARRAEAIAWAKAHALSAREMRRAPRVTVVVPCRDHGRHLPDLLVSLAAQTESPFRWLIVDDGSSERTTLSVLEDLDKAGSEVVRLGKTLGPAGARNVGLSRVATTFAACLDADDVLHPRFLERTADALEADSRLGFVFFDYRHFGAVEGPVRVPEFDEARLLEDNYVVSAAPFRVRAWKEAGGYAEELTEGLEDWEFWIRLIEHGWLGARIPETLFYYRRSRTSRNARALQHKSRIAEQIRARHRALYERVLGQGRGSTGNSSQSSR
jgi:glycosyltransferase involved in cell wall biosynthesis